MTNLIDNIFAQLNISLINHGQIFDSLYWATFLMGLAGSLHCVGMCGGISIAFNQAANPAKNRSLTLVYHSFRIISYSLLGGLVAGLGFQLTRWTDFPLLLLISGILMVLLGGYFLDWASPLMKLEKQGFRLWKRLQPLQTKLLPIKGFHQAMGIGLLWGFLPCGLIYSALAMASAAGSAINGFIAMLAFGLGTAPALLSLTFLGRRFTLSSALKKLKVLFAIIFILWGGFNIYSALWGSSQKHAHHHQA